MHNFRQLNRIQHRSLHHLLLKDVQFIEHLCSVMYMVLYWSWVITTPMQLFGSVLRADNPCLVTITYIGSSWERTMVLGGFDYFDVFFVFTHPGSSKPVLRAPASSSLVGSWRNAWSRWSCGGCSDILWRHYVRWIQSSLRILDTIPSVRQVTWAHCQRLQASGISNVSIYSGSQRCIFKCM